MSNSNTPTLKLPDNTRLNRMNTGPISTPYKCKRCGDSGRITSNGTNASCPNCGQIMEYTTRSN